MTATSKCARWGFAVGAAFLGCAFPCVVLAQPEAARARDPIAAETLFARGKQLIDQGHTSQACAAFAESLQLDPAGGTLLRLALCHEAEGKLASAWLEFTEVVRVSKEATGEPTKLTERVRIAREHLATIEPRLPKLVVSVPEGARVADLRVTANGLPRNRGIWGVAVPIDAGDVQIVAEAPGRQTFRTSVRAEEGRQVSVEVPPLEVEAGAPSPAPNARDESLAPAPSPFPLRPVGIGVAAAGVAVLGIGTYFGLTAISRWNDSNKQCPGTACNAESVSLAHDAKQAATISDVTFGVGVAAVVAGVVFFVLGAPKNVTARGPNVIVAF
jgi:hypothetical protein